MKRTLLFAAALLFCAACETSAGDPLALWYDEPAARWEETLPLGNGRLGAMPDGGVLRERLILNDVTCWSGSEQPTANPEALDYLPRIRALLLEGRNLEAQRMMYRHFVCSGGGSAEAAYGSYEMLGRLDFDFAIDTTGLTGYRRALSRSDAAARTRFEAGGVVYERDYFVSRTADVVAVRLRASKRGALSFRMTLSRPSCATTEAAGDRLTMCGQLPSGREGVEGVKIRSEAAVRTRGGSVTAADGALAVEGADET
ncbi:MAG: glycoside hydrolase family 95 protein [Alistipes sp.]|nr:glycoside hydrolase family 95 protein [Alistipes sp.]